MAKRIEEPEFELVESFNEFDVRHYRANIQARVQTDGSGAASGGFVALHATSSEETNRGNPLQ